MKKKKRRGEKELPFVFIQLYYSIKRVKKD